MESGEVFALLDDARAVGEARSRLYSGHVDTLACEDASGWAALLDAMQAALRRGLYAVPLLSYELGACLDGLPARAVNGPLARVLLFDRCEHLTGTQVEAWLATRVDEAPAGVAGIAANVDKAQFIEAIGRIRDYIAAGDTYQVNYTYRLRFDAFGPFVSLYARLRARQPVPYGALVTLPDGGALLSFSPELFVRHEVRNDCGLLLARPMKGTAPASGVEDIDAERARALAQDTKNRAENLMIVDLLRNDLGRVAQTGSVEVPALFEVQRYGAVLQMTSTVQARLRDTATLADIFAALYPCGSITGAPKRRTMEIIHELEPDARGIYTGAIGWFDPPQDGRAFGDFCMSVPIRTLALGPAVDGVRRGELGVGAGIVYDSDAQAEYAECRLKARFLTGLQNDFEIFETLRGSRDHGCRHLEQHLDRIAASCAYFGRPFDRGAAHVALLDACNALPTDAVHRLRLAVSPAGTLSVTSGALTPLQEPVTVLLADQPTHSGDVFLRHKTSVRSRYDAAWKAAEARGAFDMLFFNERDELTEGGRSNVFVRFDTAWFTPPLAAGVLPGVMRRVLLDAPAWNASERTITRAMLAQADDIVVCNALRGPLRAVLAA